MKEWEGSPRGESKQTSTRHSFTVLLFILFVLITSFLFIRSAFFTVGTIVVEGNKYVTMEDIYRIADIPEKINIFSLDTSEIRNRLTQDLRIADVSVERKFPSTIVIHVTERKPLAYIASGYGFVEVDKEGIILAAFKNLKQVSVPMVTGIRLDNGYVGDRVEHPIAKKVLIYLSLLEEDTLNTLSEINIKPNEEIIGYTINSVELRLGTVERLQEKAKFSNDILKEIQQKKIMVEYIDLNYTSPFIKFKQP